MEFFNHRNNLIASASNRPLSYISALTTQEAYKLKHDRTKIVYLEEHEYVTDVVVGVNLFMEIESIQFKISSLF